MEYLRNAQIAQFGDKREAMNASTHQGTVKTTKFGEAPKYGSLETDSDKRPSG